MAFVAFNYGEELKYENEHEEKFEQFLNDEKAISILKKLRIYKEEGIQENIKAIKKYIVEDLKGKYIGNKSIEKFINGINMYLNNEDFGRIEMPGSEPDGFVDYNLLLPISYTETQETTGFRRRSDVLGVDGNIYIMKEAERLKGAVAGRKNCRDGVYNPTIANAIFEYLGEESAESIPSYEKVPYMYLISKNFLKENQKLYRLDNREFFTEYKIQKDENFNIKHSQILETIEATIRSKYSGKMSEEKLDELCKKLKLQYSVQETIKKLIVSMDENLGNTAIIVTENEKGEMQDINVSPAYDMDLSFLLGKELIYNPNSVLFRTDRNGKKDLKSIMEEFKEIPGYKEKMKEFADKFTGRNYTEEIFNIAYEKTKINNFKSEEMKRKFGDFLKVQIADFKAIVREDKSNELKENSISE